MKKLGACGLIFAVLVMSACSKKEQASAVIPKLKGMELKTSRVPQFKEFVGQVYGRQDVPIRARVDGFLEGLHFSEGRKVSKGQLLYTIDPQPFELKVQEAESQWAETRVNLVNAENELRRIEPLAEINAVSKRDLDAARAKVGAAEAQVQAAKARVAGARVNLSYTRILSPIDGLIGKTKAKVGEYVGREPNPVILNTVSKLDSVYVEFFINENDYLGLIRKYLDRSQRPADSTSFELVLSDGSHYPEPGVFRFLDRGLDASTGSLLMQVAFANPRGEIRPGQFAKIRVNVEQLEGVYLVPQRAVIELQGRYFVWLADAGGKTRQQSVERLGTQGPNFAIRSDFKPGDRLITEAIQVLRPDVQVEIMMEETTSNAAAAKP